jgi:uncharacterized protein with WD repeat
LFTHPRIKLDRGSVAQDITNFNWAPENFPTLVQLATEILNISCAMSVDGPSDNGKKQKI